MKIFKKTKRESINYLKKLLKDNASVLSYNQSMKIKEIIQKQTEQNKIFAEKLTKSLLLNLAVIQLIRLKYTEHDISEHPELALLMMNKILINADSNGLGEELNDFCKEYKYKAKL